MTAETERRYDVVVIGGGAAGLSGALTLARARCTVLVIDGGRPRNGPAHQVHTYLGCEGTSPQDLLTRGRTEVTGYGGEIEDGTVVAVERTGQGAFRVVLDHGAVTAGRLLVTTGLGDGRVVPCDAVVVAPRFVARAGVLDGLGVRTAEQEKDGHVVGTYVPAAPDGATDVPGVWVAGNVANLFEQVIGAAAAGVRAGAAINADLVAEETDRAVGAEFWDARYRESDQIWSGDPNAALVREISSLTPGSALDLGCGEGADAIWLAERGWRVTAVDISAVALERAERHAAKAGVAVDWQRHDLGTSFPAGTFDLVCAQFLHSPVDMPRERILRMAAAAVAPGGVLLVVGHAGLPPWEHDHPDVHLPTPQEVFESLHLTEGQWEVERSEEHPRTQVAPDGRTMTRTDNTLRVRRGTEPAVSR